MAGKHKNLICIICCAAALVIAVWLLGKLVEPKYMSGVLEGAMTAEYYGEELPHDAIFIGDCEVYENFSPVTLWEEQGITSYIRGSAQQLIWQSYWLLAETFEYESPSVVVYNVQAMKYSEPQDEAYNRMTIDGMKLSEYKLGAIRDSMTDGEDWISCLVPLARYHSRWQELTDEDFKYWFSRDAVTSAGYLMRADVRPMTQLPWYAPEPESGIDAVCWEYLDKIARLCEDNGATLILVKAPSLYPHWYDEWDAEIAEYAADNGIDYYNFIDLSDEIGIDMQTDTYDGGLHLNLYGAVKLTSWFGELLSEKYGLADRSGDPKTAAVWTEKAEWFHALENAQLAELEEYGYLKSWTLGDG